MSGNNSDGYTDGTDNRCETEGCHRQAEYEVRVKQWKGGKKRENCRVICKPCRNAIEYHDNLVWGDHPWKVQPLPPGGDCSDE